jgi:hypothetical protein
MAYDLSTLFDTIDKAFLLPKLAALYMVGRPSRSLAAATGASVAKTTAGPAARSLPAS